MKKYFFPNKRKSLSLFRTDVSIISHAHALRTLGAGAVRNREIMKPVRTLLVSNSLNCRWI